MVEIAYNKGVILCEQYHERLNGELFPKFIEEHFKSCFEKSANPHSKLFLQYGDPSQNSKKARESLKNVGARQFDIPARSPIENVFRFKSLKLRSLTPPSPLLNNTLKKKRSVVKIKNKK